VNSLTLKPLPLSLSIALCITPTLALADKSPHSFKAEVEGVGRTNTNISLAPSSNSSFDFASVSDFDDEGDDAEGEDEDDEDEIEDIEGGEFDEDLLEESVNPDADGDGIDDLIDEEDDEEDDEDDDEDGEGGSNSAKAGGAKAARRSSKEERFTAKLGLGHKYKFGDHSWGTTVKLSSDTQPDRSELDKLNTAFSTGPSFKLSKKVGMKLAASYINLRQDDEKFLSTWVGTIGFSFDASKTLGFDVGYNYQDKDVSDEDSPDGIVNTVTLGAEWKMSKSDILKLKYSPKVEDSSIVTRNKDVSGYQIAYSRKIPAFAFFGESVLGLGFKHDAVDYKNLRPRTRKDDIDAYAVQWETEFNKAMSLSLAYEERKRDSNINKKDGKNRSFVVNFGFKF
jgi:hypothetical protein